MQCGIAISIKQLGVDSKKDTIETTESFQREKDVVCSISDEQIQCFLWGAVFPAGHGRVCILDWGRKRSYNGY